MPEVNFNLLNSTPNLYSGPQVALDPQKAYAEAQTQQQQNMLAQLYAKHYDPQTGDVNYNSLIGEAAQNPLTARAIPNMMGEAQSQAQKQQALAQKNALEEEQRATAATKQQTMFDTGVKNSQLYSRSQLDSITTPDEFIRWHEANHADPYLSRYFALHGVNKDDSRAGIEKTLAQPGGLQLLIDKSKRALDSVLGVKAETTGPKLGAYNPSDYTTASWAKFVKTQNPDDLHFKPTATQEKIAAGSSGTGEKTLTALQQQNLRKSKAEDQTNIDTLKNTADQLETLTDHLVGNKAKGIAPHKGLSAITGWSGAILNKTGAPPNTEARTAQQKFETIKGKVMALGRQLATEHGKLGNMAVQEWKFISEAVQKIDPLADNFEAQLRDIVDQARQLETRAKSKYEMEYNETSTAGAQPTGAGKTGQTKSGTKYTVE